MAAKIRLKRFGKKRSPYYRVVVIDSRAKRDGRAIEEIGKYHPTEEPSVIVIDSERVQYWLSVGAQPSDQVKALLKLTGDWGKFKGDKDAKSTVKFAAGKANAEEAIKAHADEAEKLKAAKSAAKEKAAKEAEEAAKAAAAEAEAAANAAESEAEAKPEADVVADESSEVPADEGTDVDVEIAEGNPSDADDKVEGTLDEEAK
jgi:small subunit ribosomal protein S16